MMKEIEKREKFARYDVRYTICYEDYDQDCANDGGSYYQPYISCTAPYKGSMTIEDTSCGDFGTRIDVTIYQHRPSKELHAHYGTMLNEDEQYSELDLSTACQAYWLAFARTLGYNIPTFWDFYSPNEDDDDGKD